MCVNTRKLAVLRDKTKIGEAVKGIPKVWTQFQKVASEDSPEEAQKKIFFNSILVDRKPYFFIYKYDFLRKEYNEYVKKNEEVSLNKFALPLQQLITLYNLPDDYPEKQSLTFQQSEFIRYYYKFMPVIDSPCVMNRICHYIESVDFHIKQKVKSSANFDYTTLMTPNFTVNYKIYPLIKEEVDSTIKMWEEQKKILLKKKKTFDIQMKFEKDARCLELKQRLNLITSNEEQLANHLIYLFYVERPSYSKDTLWRLVGKQIFDNVKSRTKSFYFPVINPSGSLTYLYKKYSIERILIDECFPESEEIEQDKI